MSNETYTPAAVIAMTINELNGLVVQGENNVRILGDVYHNLHALYDAYTAQEAQKEDEPHDADDRQGENV